LKINQFLILTVSILIFGLQTLHAQKGANVESRPEGGFTKKIAGSWNCGENGILVLKQNGNKVTGTYSINGGSVKGNIVGDRLIVTWKETVTSDSGSAEFEIEIRRMSPDPTHLTGKYKFKGEDTWNSGWDCEK
jgi:hypothetical protein